VNEASNDDRLRDLLQSHDPAASLPPAGPDRVARLLEDAMSHDVETPTHDPSHPKADPRRRTPLTWLVAAAATLVIVGVGAFAILGSEDQPTASPPPESPDATVLRLSAPTSTQSRCAMVTVERLAVAETAFEGTVTSLDDRAVTLRVDRWYRGGDADLVEVSAPQQHLLALVQSVTFEKGGRYLVTATDGAVSVCGFSAPYSDDLAALYAEAFAS
jgi:hypothetical protein